jgi:hypothetical protein
MARRKLRGAEREGTPEAAPQERRTLASAWMRWRPLEIAQIARRVARTAAGGDGAAVSLASAQDARCTMEVCAVADLAGARNYDYVNAIDDVSSVVSVR